MVINLDNKSAVPPFETRRTRDFYRWQERQNKNDGHPRNQALPSRNGTRSPPINDNLNQNPKLYKPNYNQLDKNKGGQNPQQLDRLPAPKSGGCYSYGGPHFASQCP